MMAAVSFGKHDPPQPRPAPRNADPIRESRPMLSNTSAESTPNTLQMFARSLARLIFDARKALLAYFIISASLMPVLTTGGFPARSTSGAKISASVSYARSVCAPRTILSGERKSSTAVPSRRNSGFIAISSPSPTRFPEASSIRGPMTSTVVRGTTVLLVTTRCESSFRASVSPSEVAAVFIAPRSMLPSSVDGVGRARNVASVSRISS